jgi:ribosomal protein L37AE/L43A
VKKHKLEYEIGKIYDAPRPCPKCGHTRAEFRTAATDYVAWWKCDKCGHVFGEIDYDPRTDGRVFCGGPNIDAMAERLRDVEKRLAKLEKLVKGRNHLV